MAQRHSRHVLARGIAAIAVGVLAAWIGVVPAAATAPPSATASASPVGTPPRKDCPTWFPDFGGCDRHGRYEGFIAPMSFPYLFEDPFITTGLQFATLWHGFPEDSVFDGGNVTVLALQARLAITDRLAFIATKDGIAFFRPQLRLGGKRLLKDQSKLMDITAGFKYALIDRPEDHFILSPSLRFEVPLGSEDVYQGYGDGVIIPGLSAAWGYDDFHVISDVGWQLPINGDRDSASIFYNVHVDYAVHDHFVPFVEWNGLHWTDGGEGSTPVHTTIGTLPLQTAITALGKAPFEGADVANLGSRKIRSADLTTMAWGARVPFNEHVSIGASYERAIGRQDIFEQRATAMLLVEY